MLDRNEIERMAALARLQLDEEEAGRLAGDCGRILQYFEAIQELEPGGGDAPGSAGGTAPLREDRVDALPLARRPEEMAPAWRDGYFVLPRLPAMDGEAEGGGAAGEGDGG